MKALIRQKNVNSLAAPVPVFTRRDVKMPAIKGKAIAVAGTRRTSGCLTTERDSAAAPFVGSAEAAACCTSGRNRSTSLAVPSRARVCLRSTCKDSRRSPAQLCRNSPPCSGYNCHAPRDRKPPDMAGRSRRQHEIENSGHFDNPYLSRPSLLSSDINRGSERSGSTRGSPFSQITWSFLSSYAFSSHSSAWSFFPMTQ